jgi:hypothetical protein
MADEVITSPAVPPTVAQIVPTPPSYPVTVPATYPTGALGSTTYPSTVRNLTTADKFVLVDANHDGVIDTIVVELYDAVAAAKAAEDLKYAPYHAALVAAKDGAAKANAGKSAIEITAAENVAVAQAKVDWVGPTPPWSKFDDVVKAAEAKVAADAAAIKAEVVRLSK